MAEFMAAADTPSAKGSSIFASDHDRYIVERSIMTLRIWTECISASRVCYHSATSMPVHINELDEDSEEELDPEWMRSKMEMVSTDELQTAETSVCTLSL